MKTNERYRRGRTRLAIPEPARTRAADVLHQRIRPARPPEHLARARIRRSRVADQSRSRTGAQAAPGWSIREINLLRDEAERSIWRERLVAELAIGFAIVACSPRSGCTARSPTTSRAIAAASDPRGDRRGAFEYRRIAGEPGGGLIVACAAIGLVASFALSGWVRALLFGVAPSDPVSMGVAVALLLGIATVALLLPAWRATRIDPAVTLREESKPGGFRGSSCYPVKDPW